MLNVNPETVRFVINSAHNFQAQDSGFLDEERPNPLDSTELEFPDASAESTTSQEFSSTINDLEPDQQQSLVALMWLGRGDFSIDEWEAALSQARESWTLHTAEYLQATPLLADYLQEGLALHGYEED